MRIGIDLDNTIVCYDDLFHRVAVRQALVPANLARDKQAVRDYLRGAGRNDKWTELQGLVYGRAMSEAQPFPGAADFFRAALRSDCDVFVISHRTRYPYLGEQHDLHQAARDWLGSSGLLDSSDSSFLETSVFLEESLAAKLQRIATQRCDVFIDDLPELLLRSDFPADVERICFDPAHRCQDSGVACVHAWCELTARWFDGECP